MRICAHHMALLNKMLFGLPLTVLHMMQPAKARLCRRKKTDFNRDIAIQPAAELTRIKLCYSWIYMFSVGGHRELPCTEGTT